MNLTNLLKEIDLILNSDKQKEDKLQFICDYLRKEVKHYHWVGFYFKNGEKRELKLAQFSGKPTEHTTIPFGKGICGQVAESNKNLIVQDVQTEDNYISCGIDIKSEIVIPIIVNSINIGQIDIDSHDLNPFCHKDTELLEYICAKLSKIL